MKWSITYEGAYLEDGSLYFPEKLSHEVLQNMRKTMGLYKFTNQYRNEIIPDEDQDFKAAWWREYTVLPQDVYTFMFIDPAISLMDGADYTATVVVHVDCDQNWYVQMADRRRITATDTVRHIFNLYQGLKPMAIGVEDVAYQKALLHFLHEEMQRRNQFLPIKGVRRSNITTDGARRSNNSKPYRIRSLVPRFEFNKIFVAQGLDDLLVEYKSFPRGSHDDLLDALSSIEEIVFYPDKPKENTNVTNPNDPRYEQFYIRNLIKEKTRAPSEEY